MGILDIVAERCLKVVICSLFAVAVLIEYLYMCFVKKDMPILSCRLKKADNKEYAATGTGVFGVDTELEELSKELQPLIPLDKSPVEKADIILRWLVGKCAGFGFEVTANTPYGRLKQISAGKKAHCTDLAIVLLASLISCGIKARYIIVNRSLFDKKDSHATVEVWDGSRWVIKDPFFNGHFLIEGRMASAADVHEALLRNKEAELSFVSEDTIGCPVSFEDYYIKPIVLFNYVRVASILNYGMLSKLPVFRYFSGTQHVFKEDKDFSMSDYGSVQKLARFFNLTLPLAIGALIVILVLMAVI